MECSPERLMLSNSGVISGTPQRASRTRFVVEARDGEGATSLESFTSIENLPLSPITLHLSRSNAGEQADVIVEISEPAPIALSGSLSLHFESNGKGNPEVRFSNGANPQFTIAEGQRLASFVGGPLGLQLGTVAGVDARMAAGGIDVTPNPPPRLDAVIPATAPVITSLTHRLQSDSIVVEVTWFSSKEVTAALFQFTTRQGAIVPTVDLVVDLRIPMSQWYLDTRSAEFGSAFKVSLPFNVRGTVQDVPGVSVNVVNSIGRSANRRTDF
jgi:hypothetical protein